MAAIIGDILFDAEAPIIPRVGVAETRYGSHSLPQGHIPALDAVRGVAILLVMGFHFTMMTANDNRLSMALCKVAVLGRCGVDLFFVLSGFLITGLLFEAKGSIGYFRTFYARRILRIFPLYYCALILLLGVLPVVFGLRVHGFDEAARHQSWLWLHSSNIGLLARGDGTLGSFGHFWSLAVEEHFYLLWPALIFCFNRNALLRICVGIAIGSLALRTFLMFSGDNETACYLLTPCRIDQLAIGGWVALAARGPRGLTPLVRPARWVAGLALLALLILLGTRDRFRDGTHNDRLMPTIGYSILALGFVSSIVLAIAQHRETTLGRVVNAAPLRMFGKYSYALYIFHMFLFDLVLDVLPVPKTASVTRYAGSYLLAGTASLFISLLVAWLSWHLLEKRFLSLKRFFSYERRAARIVAPLICDHGRPEVVIGRDVAVDALTGRRNTTASLRGTIPWFRLAGTGIMFFAAIMGIAGLLVMWHDRSLASLPASLFWYGFSIVFTMVGVELLRGASPTRNASSDPPPS